MSRTILITGASRGIGYETAKAFLAGGDVAAIGLVARPSADFDAAEAELTALAGSGVTVRRFDLDVAVRQDIVDIVPRLLAGLGRIDILVNNAGYCRAAEFAELTFEELDLTIRTNLYAPFTLVQELIRAGNRFDAIVNIGSTSGLNGRLGWMAYSASKAALINFSEVLRQELAPQGTRVVCLCPGRTATAMRHGLFPEEDPASIMQPAAVAAAVVTMVGPVGRYLNSQPLVVRD